MKMIIIIIIIIMMIIIIIIQHKYRQVTFETLSKDKPHNRHSPEKSRTQPEHLSIDQYTSWQLPLISTYKTYHINKNMTDIAG